MSFSADWRDLLDELDDVPSAPTFLTPLSNERFTIEDTQEHRIVVRHEGTDDSRPLQRDQFESLYRRIGESSGGFDLENVPTGAEPYVAVWSLHPRYEIDADAGVIRETDEPTTTQLIDADTGTETSNERAEPDVPVYADALLLVDALERHPVGELEMAETDALVNLYTLLSDVQRNANDLRREIADVLLGRVHHDRPVYGQYGSVQRTSRRRRSLEDDEEVVSTLEAAGIDRERVMSVDADKVDQALEVTGLSASEVYEIDETEYVRKAEVDEDRKETRLQGLKDRLATSDDPEAEELRGEVAELEARIEELTEFRSGRQYHTQSRAE
jgi:hypothetical protein